MSNLVNIKTSSNGFRNTEFYSRETAEQRESQLTQNAPV